MTSAIPVLVARGLRKQFGRGVIALDGVDLELRPGETLGLVGTNGAGKTTALRILAGLLRPDAGSVQLRGVDIVADPAAARRAVGVLPDEDDAPSHLTAQEALELAGRLHGLDADVARDRTSDLLDLLRVDARDRDRLIGTYSTGTRRKVLLACALIHTPDVLLLDEPLSGLDPLAAAVVRGLLDRLSTGGRAVLFSSHTIEVVEPVCHRIAVLHQGRLVTCGPADALRSAAGLPADTGLRDTVLRLIGPSDDGEVPPWLV